MSAFLIRRLARLSVCLLAVAAAGCADRSNARYTPSEDSARQALEAALTAWQKGQAQPGAIPDATPAVQAVDSRWQAGDRLQTFEVVGEESNLGGPRVFTVRLTMQAPVATKTLRYYVVGVEPLWVYREDDYQQPAGM
jgi:hypothetical protein